MGSVRVAVVVTLKASQQPAPTKLLTQLGGNHQMVTILPRYHRNYIRTLPSTNINRMTFQSRFIEDAKHLDWDLLSNIVIKDKLVEDHLKGQIDFMDASQRYKLEKLSRCASLDV